MTQANTAPITLEQYENFKPVMYIEANGKRAYFRVRNSMTAWRVQSLPTKEPVTMAWIAEMMPGEVMLDIGANVGMYTIVASVLRGVRVIAFEPESQNFAMLNLNIEANKVGDRVVAYPLAVSDSTKLDQLYLSALDVGGSCHSFGEEVGFDLKARPAAFKQGAISISIDEAIRSGAVPYPTHIKIDVDGFEHLVIAGARQTLSRPELKSLLIELNTNLPEHMAVFDQLAEHGFSHDAAQMQKSLRKSGAFAGVGEVVFRRASEAAAAAAVASEEPGAAALSLANSAGPRIDYSRSFNLAIPSSADMRDVLRHVLEKLEAAPIETDPFPYVVIDGIFPEGYYQRILEAFPDESSFVPIDETGRVSPGSYKERGVVLFERDNLARIPSPRREFWQAFSAWLYSDLFVAGFVNKFAEVLDYRLQRICADGVPLRVRSDALLVKDRTNYEIGPHTDSPYRLVSFLFYMPADRSLREYGTAFYRAKDKDFTCWGGPHYDFADFERASTMEFLPNRLVAFPKTERTFHGVEPVARPDVARHLLINNIRILNRVTH